MTQGLKLFAIGCKGFEILVYVKNAPGGQSSGSGRKKVVELESLTSALHMNHIIFIVSKSRVSYIV